MATTYVALLRGINVGGRNKIRMVDLRSAFESAGFGRVSTYIQSGNVIFDADAVDRVTLTASIERLLSERFGYDATITLRSRAELRATVRSAPAGFGTRPEEYRSDVLFLLPPLTPAEAIAEIALKDGVDEVWPGPGAVYSARLSARLSASGLSRLATKPVYQQMTIRNWNTTTRLLALLDAR
jgi:uncharacterized protein (DUF1697 family)